jgi:ATP-dependent Clp endopeptidase proteolytic subunit ClpP
MFKVSDRSIYIYDEISDYFGVGSSQIIEALEDLGDTSPISIRINSPGGDVVEGLAIFNAIRRHSGAVNTFNDSLAASCGSYIFAAGDNRVAAANSILMIHDPWGMSIGNAAEHRKTADTYDKFADSLVRDYATSSGLPEDEIRNIMAAETWYGADDALAQGFATEIGDEIADLEPIEARSLVSKGIAATASTMRKGKTASTRGGLTALEIRSKLYRSRALAK